MARREGVKIIEPWKYDLFFQILKDAYTAIFFSYRCLHTKKNKNPYTRPENKTNWYLEDIITDELIKDEENLPKLLDYRIINQQKDANKNTKIDIAIQWSLTIGNSYDIKVECKLLNKTNLDYILRGGIKKFKSNSYADKLPLAGMLFYNTNNYIEANLNSLNRKIISNLSVDEILNRFELIENYDYTYKSIHSRASNSNIDIYSMILDFREIVVN